MASGYITEIFSSLQGEGPYVGERQIFIRLAGCPWRCDYCDTPDSLTAAGAKSMTVEQVLDEVHHLLEEKEQKTVSVTGGEPLAQVEFLTELLPALRRLGLRTYLETSGTMPEPLKRVVEHCDVVAMDVKLPSSIGRPFWDEHREFLAAAEGKVFVKLVMTSASTEEELKQTLALLVERTPPPCLVLQPATGIEPLDVRLKNLSATSVASADNPSAGHVLVGAENAGQGNTACAVAAPDLHQMVRWWELARERLPDVRVIPQMHPYWGLP